MGEFDRLTALDAQASARLAISPPSRCLRLLAQIIAHSGDSLLWMAGAAAALVWGAGPWKVGGGRIVAGTLLTGALTGLLKRTFQRHRPANETRGLYIGPDHYAFPSGHAARTACLVLLLAPLLPPWCALLLPVWALGVGLARVALGIHFASDIIAGWLVGLASGLLLLALAAISWPFGLA